MFNTNYVYRLFSAADWVAVKAGRIIPYAPHDEADGFLHLSNHKQVLETARLHYHQFDTLIAAGFPLDEADPLLKWEASRGGELFPHYYGEVLVEWIDHEVRLFKQGDKFILEPPQ